MVCLDTVLMIRVFLVVVVERYKISEDKNYCFTVQGVHKLMEFHKTDLDCYHTRYTDAILSCRCSESSRNISNEYKGMKGH